MGFLKVTITGSLRQAMKDEIRIVSAGLRRAVDRTGKQVQDELRKQAGGGGFKDSGRAIGRSWRLKKFPRPGVVTFNPAAEVTTNMPDAVDAFEKGREIVVRRRRWLVWPTGFNAQQGRRNAGRRQGMRVTPEQMLQAGKGQAFVIRSKSNPSISLWCLKVKARFAVNKLGKETKRIKLFVGTGKQVATGKHIRNQQKWRKELLEQGFVPMFFMSRRVRPGKRLDVEGVHRRAASMLLTNVIAELKD